MAHGGGGTSHLSVAGGGEVGISPTFSSFVTRVTANGRLSDYVWFESSPPNREVAMFNRSYFFMAITAIVILGAEFSLSVHHLNAATTQVFQMHRNYPGAMDGPTTCPAAATRWCQNVGGLAD